MADIELVKTDKGLLGATPADQSAWKKFKTMLDNLGAGEFLSISYRRPRNPRFHRKMFALFQLGFEHWTPDRKRFSYKGQPIEKDFEVFRKEITILAGFYRQVFNVNGKMELQAESLAFASMTEERFEQCFNAVANVMLDRILTNYKREDIDRVVEKLVNFTQ